MGSTISNNGNGKPRKGKTNSVRDSVLEWTASVKHYPQVKSMVLCSKFCPGSVDPSLEMHDQDTCFKYHALKKTIDTHLKQVRISKDRAVYQQHQTKVKKEEQEQKLKEVAERANSALLKFEEREQKILEKIKEGDHKVSAAKVSSALPLTKFKL